MGNTASAMLSEFFLRCGSDKDYPFDYISTMPRRGTNDLELMVARRPELEAEYARFLSESGLLMQAEDIADYYIREGRFPQIAMYDDILVHGRSLSRFLRNFYDLICECLRRRGVFQETDEFQKNFCKAITLCVFTVNDNPVLLDHDFQWRLYYQELCSEDIWRKWSREISDEIWKSDIANTSYILSAKIKTTDLNLQKNSDMWLEYESFYFKRKQKFYLSKLSFNYKMLPTVRSYIGKEYCYFTPYFFTEPFTLDQAKQIVAYISAYLRQQNNKRLDELVDLIERAAEYEQRYVVYCQFIYLLLSQITLQTFLKDFALSADQVEFDTKKIARNFGFADDVKPMLDELCNLQWPERYMEAVCQQAQLSKHSLCLEWPKNATLEDTICDSVEMAIYDMALKHEKHAKEMESIYATGRVVSIETLDSTGETEFNKFLDDAFESINEPQPNITMVMFALSHLTQMMDRGDVSLKARIKQEKDTFIFSSAVRCTEMSLSILPHKLDRYYDYVFLLTQLSWMDDDFPEQMKQYFEDVLVKTYKGAGKYTKWAVKFAEAVRGNRSILESILNWKKIVKR